VQERPIPAPAAPGKTQGTYEVKKGDTLAKIATQNNPGGVSLPQMLIALYRANPDAFTGNNINRLRAGRILNLPDQDAANAVDQADARRLVTAQGQDFRAYQSKLAGAVAAAPAGSAAGERNAAGRITPKAEEPAPAEKKDQLKLSKAEPTGKGAASQAARADNAAAREKALKESESRVADLEKNVADLRKLLELKNQTLAELEKKGAAKPAAVPAPAAPAPVPATPAKPAPEAAKAAPPPPTPAPAPAPVAAKAPEAPKPAPEAAKAPEAPKGLEAAKAPEATKAPEPAKAPAAAPKPPEAAKAKPKAAPPPPPPPPSLVDEFLDKPIALGGLALVVLLLVGYGWWAWKRKKAQQSRFQDSVMGAPPAASLGASSVFSGAASQNVDTGAAVSQASISDSSVGAIEADEVDPIAEADVYMAYGRDTQAEEILKDALNKDPNRLAIHSKLLEIYAARRDVQNLEQTAMKIKELTGGEGEDWDKAIVLGRTTDPGNALYGGDPEATVMVRPAGPVAAAAPTLDFDLDAAAPAAGPDIGLESGASAAAPSSVDFDLGAGEAAPAAPAQPEEKSDFAPGGTIIMDSTEAQSASGGLDFDLGMGEPAKPAAPAPAAASPAPALDAGGLDFNLDLDTDSDKTVMMPSQPKAADVDLSAISFDLGTPEVAAPAGEGDPRWQEVATKLDLAKAYDEMGDKDGARDLLNEVAKEGDGAQQNQARQMLAKLG
jgi:pilus assembly protein FimV